MGNNWKNWRMTPTCRPRQAAIWSSLMPWMAFGPTQISPDDGRSMPVIMLISVDLPAPDLPTTATNSPCRTSRSIPRSAKKSPAGVR